MLDCLSCYCNDRRVITNGIFGILFTPLSCLRIYVYVTSITVIPCQFYKGKAILSYTSVFS